MAQRKQTWTNMRRGKTQRIQTGMSEQVLLVPYCTAPWLGLRRLPKSGRIHSLVTYPRLQILASQLRPACCVIVAQTAQSNHTAHPCTRGERNAISLGACLLSTGRRQTTIR